MKRRNYHAQRSVVLLIKKKFVTPIGILQNGAFKLVSYYYISSENFSNLIICYTANYFSRVITSFNLHSVYSLITLPEKYILYTSK